MCATGRPFAINRRCQKCSNSISIIAANVCESYNGFLLWSAQRLQVITDHQSLEFFLKGDICPLKRIEFFSTKSSNPSESFGPPGALNCLSDVLSRNPLEEFISLISFTDNKFSREFEVSGLIKVFVLLSELYKFFYVGDSELTQNIFN